jgi:hypothetical protein
MGDDTKTFLPAPSPEMVGAARAYLTPRYAVGVDQVLWELMEHPVPLENRARVIDLQVHAARWYWLIRPPRIGCRRTERKSARSEIGRVTVVSTFGGRWPRD